MMTDILIGLSWFGYGVIASALAGIGVFFIVGMLDRRSGAAQARERLWVLALAVSLLPLCALIWVGVMGLPPAPHRDAVAIPHGTSGLAIFAPQAMDGQATEVDAAGDVCGVACTRQAPELIGALGFFSLLINVMSAHGASVFVACGVMAGLAALGGGLLAMAQGIVRRRILSRMMADMRTLATGPAADAVAAWSATLGVSRQVRLCVSRDAVSPFATRLRAPCIVLPERMIAADGDVLRLVIGHEMAHIRRRDELMRPLQSFVAYVFWFSPVVRAMVKRIDAAREEICDAYALGSLGGAAQAVVHSGGMNSGWMRKAYAQALVDGLSRASQVAAQAQPIQTGAASALFSPDARSHKLRIRAILSPAAPFSALRQGVSVLALAGIGVALTACAGPLGRGLHDVFDRAEANTQREETIVAKVDVATLEAAAAQLGVPQDSAVGAPKDADDATSGPAFPGRDGVGGSEIAPEPDAATLPSSASRRPGTRRTSEADASAAAAPTASYGASASSGPSAASESAGRPISNSEGPNFEGPNFEGAHPLVIADDARISSSFGPRIDPYTREDSNHSGVDIAGEIGTLVYAPLAGTVRKAGPDGRFGTVVMIDLDNGARLRLAHLKDHAVYAGQRVEAGDIVAFMGNSGQSTGPHLHADVKWDGRYRDPERLGFEVLRQTG